MHFYGHTGKLSSYLVRAKLYRLERKVGSFKCKGKRCQICLNVNETDFFASLVTKEEYKINHCFNCNKRCLIYPLTCKVCLKQYVGKTVDEFRLRCNNYKTNNRKHQRLESCIQEHLFDHFNEEGHHGFFEDVSITFIDKTDPSEPLKRENYCNSVLKTMASLGLNIEDSVWETFSGITDGMFVDKVYGLRLLLFLLIIYHNCWRSLLKVFLGGWLSVLLCNGSAGIYWKRDAILGGILGGFRGRFPLRSALERLLL